MYLQRIICSGACLRFSAYVPPVCKIVIPDGLNELHSLASRKRGLACAVDMFACALCTPGWREAGGEFKSKFGVRSGVHLSVHLRSVMRSAESFSREKHLITASVLRAPVAFEKGAKRLFSKSSEGKLITSAQTPGRDWEVSERTELHGRRHCQRLTRSCGELCPSAFIATSHIQLSVRL